MPNQYYTHDTPLVPKTTAKAEDINSIANLIETGFDLLPAPNELGSASNLYSSTTGTPNIYQVTFLILESLEEGQRISVKINIDNTGASTLNVIGNLGSLGTYPIVLNTLSSVGAGALVTGGIYTLVFSGTAWLIQSSTPGIISEASLIRDEVQDIYDEFDDRYLGAKTSDPLLDNDNNTLQAGTLYFNTVESVTKVYTGVTWVSNNQYVKYISDTPPVGAYHGQEWFDTTTGIDYTYINDGDSEQWIQQTIKNPQPNIVSDYAFTTTTLSVDSSIDILNYVNFLDASSGNLTVTLPTASTNLGIVVNCKRIDSTTNTCTVDTTGSETIDNFEGTILEPNQNLQVISDGTNWRII